MARVKVLSDFDGVWTNQGPEAAHVLEHFVARAAALTRVEPPAAQEQFEAWLELLRQEPDQHGWAPDGKDLARLTAFLDEDPLLCSSSLGRFLSLPAAPEAARAYREAILAAGFASTMEFTNRCFLEATEAFSRAATSPVVPRAKAAFQALAEAGAEVVIVSNSSSEKISRLLAPLGLPLEGSASDDGRMLRVRGHAAKYSLGASRDALTLGQRQIALDRPHYLRALEEEQPDIVLGDVFSLDLALPHSLRAHSRAGAPKVLALRRHAHTPGWVLAHEGPGRVDCVIDHLEDLVPVVRALAGAVR